MRILRSKRLPDWIWIIAIGLTIFLITSLKYYQGSYLYIFDSILVVPEDYTLYVNESYSSKDELLIYRSHIGNDFSSVIRIGASGEKFSELWDLIMGDPALTVEKDFNRCGVDINVITSGATQARLLIMNKDEEYLVATNVNKRQERILINIKCDE